VVGKGLDSIERGRPITPQEWREETERWHGGRHLRVNSQESSLLGGKKSSPEEAITHEQIQLSTKNIGGKMGE